MNDNIFRLSLLQGSTINIDCQTPGIACSSPLMCKLVKLVRQQMHWICPYVQIEHKDVTMLHSNMSGGLGIQGWGVSTCVH